MDEPDDRYVRSRVEDRSWWIKTAYVFEKYRILIWLGGAVLVAFGFGFETPAAKFATIEAQVTTGDHRLQAEIDSLREDRTEQKQMMEFSVRYICANLSPAERYRLGGTDLCAAAAHNTIR